MRRTPERGTSLLLHPGLHNSRHRDLLTGAFSLGPAAGRLGKVLAERPPDDPEALERTSCILWIARVDEMILLGTVLVMGVKPFL